MASRFEQAGHLEKFQAEREDIGWRNRSSALLDLDYMLVNLFFWTEKCLKR